MPDALSYDALFLSRVQFAFTIAFHIIFPAFTIGLASWLAAIEFQWLRTGNPGYKNLYRFWVKIFAVSFGLGVVSGIVMSYQFGTNWAEFSKFAGPVIGPVIAYEVLTAFFLEASFLGIMLFGWQRVGDRLHFFATCMVALGTLLSAFWILSANSWMQTPAGYEIVDGRAVATSYWEVVFNPSFPYRFSHMVMAAYLTTAFAVAAMSAWMMLRGRRDWAVKTSLSMALWFATIFAPVQVFLGDLQGLNVAEHQPTKLAAMEGHWENVEGEGVPLILFGWPDEEEERTKYQIAIPNLSSLIITHHWNEQFPALKEFPKELRPPVWPVFWAFRVMVAIGFLMVLLGAVSLWLRWKGALYERPWFLRWTFAMLPSGFVAVLAGWFTAEIGRQPWVVYGELTTADASSAVSAGEVATTLTAFVIVYAAVYIAGTYYLFKLLARGPSDDEDVEGEQLTRKPKRPFSAADESLDRGQGRDAPVPAE